MASYRNLQEDVVGRTDTILHRYDAFSSSMDNLLLKAISKAAGVNIAFSNGWRYGAPIDKGNITMWDLYNMVPMHPVISTVAMTGQDTLHLSADTFHRPPDRTRPVQPPPVSARVPPPPPPPPPPPTPPPP